MKHLSILIIAFVAMAICSCGNKQPQVIIVKDTVRVEAQKTVATPAPAAQPVAQSAPQQPSQLSTQPVTAAAPASQSEFWQGSIGGKYGIRMCINQATGEFWYYYTRYSSNNRMYLNVIEHSGNHLVLVENNAEGVQTGIFDGYVNGNSYAGTFTNFNSGKSYKFNLTRQ